MSVNPIAQTGFDYPELDTIVMARPTMSLALWYHQNILDQAVVHKQVLYLLWSYIFTIA